MMPRPVKRVLAWLRAPLNALHFTVRRSLRLSLGVPVLVDEPKDGLFDYLPEPAVGEAYRRESELRERYELAPLRACSTRLVYRDNLYLLDALESVTSGITPPAPGSLRAVDVGSQSFTYAFALERFLSRWGGHRRAVTLAGVEVDGWVVLRDLRSRRDHALAHVRSTGNPAVTYRVADFSVSDDRELDVVTLFYPFLTRYALLQWGLPLRLYAPERLIRRAFEALRPGGLLIVFNQTEVERNLLIRLIDGLDGEIERSEAIGSTLVTYLDETADRHATVVRRPVVEVKLGLHPAPAAVGCAPTTEDR